MYDVITDNGKHVFMFLLSQYAGGTLMNSTAVTFVLHQTDTEDISR